MAGPPLEEGGPQHMWKNKAPCDVTDALEPMQESNGGLELIQWKMLKVEMEEDQKNDNDG